MENKSKDTAHDTGGAKAKTRILKKEKHPVTEDPIAEKDEVKQAEDELRARMDKKQTKK